MIMDVFVVDLFLVVSLVVVPFAAGCIFAAVVLK